MGGGAYIKGGVAMVDWMQGGEVGVNWEVFGSVQILHNHPLGIGG